MAVVRDSVNLVEHMCKDIIITESAFKHLSTTSPRVNITIVHRREIFPLLI